MGNKNKSMADSRNNFKIYIEPGNYTPTTFCIAINFAFTNASNFPIFLNGFTGSGTIATINPNNGKIILNLSHKNNDKFKSRKKDIFKFEKTCLNPPPSDLTKKPSS